MGIWGESRTDQDFLADGCLMISDMAGNFTFKRIFTGVAVAIVSFAGLGTVSALWDNPIFVRMTPAGGWEVALLAALSLLLGAYLVIRRPVCSVKAAGAGGVLGFLGVACPVCNKVLLVLFGGELLLTYFEPIRVYVAAAGVFIVLAVVLREWTIVRKNAEAMKPGAELSTGIPGFGGL